MDVGTDIVDIERIAKLIDRHGKGFCYRFFTDLECQYCFSKPQPAQHFAGRFAIKESIIKILGAQTYKEIEVVNREDGKPILNLYGTAKKVAEKLGYTNISISISHAQKQAVAIAVAL